MRNGVAGDGMVGRGDWNFRGQVARSLRIESDKKSRAMGFS